MEKYNLTQVFQKFYKNHFTEPTWRYTLHTYANPNFMKNHYWPQNGIN